MISRYDVSLGGVRMSDLSEDLLILDVHYPEHEYTKELYNPAGTDSVIVDGLKKGPASVTVDFELHIYNISKRQKALQDVVGWCRKGGTLQVNDRPKQRLKVVCEKYPVIESVRDWTKSLSITFTAYELPYWEDTAETVLTLQGASAKGTLSVPGNAEITPVAVDVTPTETVLKGVTVKVGKNTITVSSLSCPVNKTVSIGHDSHGILTILQNGVSVLSNRTATSSDDLTAACGAGCEVSVTATSKVTAKFKVRGRWL